MFKEIKWFFQRATRGYDDQDLWSVKDFFIRVAPPLLRSMKKGVGCPSVFWDKDNTLNNCQPWHNALEEMAQGFEAAEFIDSYGHFKKVEHSNGAFSLEPDQEAFDNAVKKMNKGLKLFADNFLNLWD